MLHFFHKISDVFLTTFLAIGISFANVESALKVASLLIAIGYGLWRWIVEWKKERKNK